MSLAVQLTLALVVIEVVAAVPQQWPTSGSGLSDAGRECGSFAAVSHLSRASHGVRNTDKYVPPSNNGGMASLHNSATDLRSTTHKCGAVLISDRYLLTAAHCMTGSGSERLVSITLGKEDLDENPFPGHDTYQIQEASIHPGYGSGSHAYNDLAILKTDRKVQYNNKIYPFCLPGRNQVFGDYLAVEISGWGQVNQTHTFSTLKTAFVRIIENSRCVSQWREHASDLYDTIRKLSYPQGLTNQILCAGRQGVDACDGDSGGPMSYQNSAGLHTVIGIIGKRNTCPEFPITPGFYTNVANYIDWIVATTGLPRSLAPSNAPQSRPSHHPAATAPPRKPVVGVNGPPGVVSVGQPSLGQPSSGQPFSGRPSSGRPFSGQPSSGRPTSGRPSSGRPFSDRPSSTGQVISGAISSESKNCQFPSGVHGFCRMITRCPSLQLDQAQFTQQFIKDDFGCGLTRTNIGFIQNVCCPE